MGHSVIAYFKPITNTSAVRALTSHSIAAKLRVRRSTALFRARHSLFGHAFGLNALVTITAPTPHPAAAGWKAAARTLRAAGCAPAAATPPCMEKDAYACA